uniref:Uncharacterized protein n=1 Tax=Sphaerodactylus townsendi TaxID=933632 RepID=A0ACB8ESX1_9SAUR
MDKRTGLVIISLIIWPRGKKNSAPLLVGPSSKRRLMQGQWKQYLRSGKALMQQEHSRDQLAGRAMHKEGRQCAGPPTISCISRMDRPEEADSCHLAWPPLPPLCLHPMCLSGGRQRGSAVRQESASSGLSMRETRETAGGLL